MKSYLKQSPVPFKYVLIASFALALLLASEAGSLFVRNENAGFNITGHTILTFCKYLLWAFYTPLIYKILSNAQVVGKTKVTVFSQLFIYVLLIAVSHAIISNALYSLVLWIAIDWESARLNIGQFYHFFIPISLSRFIDIGVIFGALFAIDVYRKFNEKKVKIAELESQLKNAELASIRNQLNPHFLFNTLNTISALMDQDIEKAQEMLAKVARLLRKGLDASNKSFVTLDDEIKFIRTYLDIERERFNDKLEVVYEIDEHTLDIEVPYLILQPLVENAIKHGISNKTDSGEIRISSAIQGDHIELKVFDNGVGSTLAYNELISSGVGLKSVYDRIHVIYQDKGSLTIQSDKGSFEIMISIPIEMP